ncbi:MAG: DNA replication/repair protein RecF [Solobacterium sp.]|nr:DNA replication/repair protein RecF [Solobacterium sp.]
MIVTSLTLRNFRNYERLCIHPDPGMNLILGNNAQGKTNLLESLVYLSLTRSHRIQDDTALIKDGASFADAACVFEQDGLRREIEAVIYPKGKTLLVQKQPVRKSSEFIGLLNVVLFAPDDLTLFSDQPKDRRRIMDQELSRVSPKYLYSSTRYRAALRERNALLKEERVEPALLETMDEQMIALQKEIISMRREFVAFLDSHITGMYRNLSDDTAEVRVFYRCCVDPEQDPDEALRNMYRDNLEKDMRYHTTTVGVQREDLLFTIYGGNVIQRASQGQKRMIMMAFKLALMKFIEEKTKQRPVLLLDDVLSELDPCRAAKLLSIVSSPYQCLITSASVPSFFEVRNVRTFYIENGNMKEAQGV